MTSDEKEIYNDAIVRLVRAAGAEIERLTDMINWAGRYERWDAERTYIFARHFFERIAHYLPVEGRFDR
jgi:hypothetical protein